MEKMCRSKAIKTLRQMRKDGGFGDEADYLAAIDRALEDMIAIDAAPIAEIDTEIPRRSSVYDHLYNLGYYDGNRIALLQVGASDE